MANYTKREERLKAMLEHMSRPLPTRTPKPEPRGVMMTLEQARGFIGADFAETVWQLREKRACEPIEIRRDGLRHFTVMAADGKPPIAISR